jgi:outer membrane protein TolC
VELRYEKGAISLADEAKIETTKLEADQAVSTARQALLLAKSNLAFLLGVRDALPTRWPTPAAAPTRPSSTCGRPTAPT